MIKFLNYTLRLGLFTLSMILFITTTVVVVLYLLMNDMVSENSLHLMVILPIIYVPLTAYLTIRSCYKYEQTLDPEYSWKKRKAWIGF